MIDINSFIDIYAARLFSADADWSWYKNMYLLFYDNKWHWMIYDIDGGLGAYGNSAPDRDSFTLPRYIKKESLATDPLFPYLMKNADFRRQFVNTFMDLTNYTFKEEKVRAELVDFYATALDFAGVESSHTHFGHSLRRNLVEHDYQHRQFTISEGGRMPEEIHCDEYHASLKKDDTSDEYYPKKLAQSDPDAHAKGTMMRWDRYKYISRVNRKDELYDLKEDPGETTNLIDRPEHQEMLSKMRTELLYWLESTSDIVPFEFDARFNGRGMLSLIGSHLSPEQYAKCEKAIDQGKVFLDFAEIFQFAMRPDQ